MFSKKHIQETIILAAPVAFSQLGHITVGVADTLMAGQISKDALAASTVALSVFFPLFMMYVGFSIGFTPLIAQAHGEAWRFKRVPISARLSYKGSPHCCDERAS